MRRMPVWVWPPLWLPVCLLCAVSVGAAPPAPSVPAAPSALFSAAPASRYARLTAGQGFTARREEGHLRYEGYLRLLPRGFFQLDERLAWKKQPPLRRVSSGLGFQLEGGALLWLYNRYGLSRSCNVGEGGALYADMPLPGQGGSLSVVFRPAVRADVPSGEASGDAAGAAQTAPPHAAEGDGEPLRLMGLLRREPGGVVFVESASGLEFALEGSLPDPLPELPPEEAGGRPLPRFLELEGRLSGARLILDRVLAVSGVPPSGPEEGPPSLAVAAGEGPWLLELPGGRRLSASLALSPPAGAAAREEPPSYAGRLDLAGKDLYLSLPLTTAGRRLRLALSGRDRAMLRALGHEALMEDLLSLRRWAVYGPLLVFHDGDGEPRCILTRRGGDPAAGPGAGGW